MVGDGVIVLGVISRFSNLVIEVIEGKYNRLKYLDVEQNHLYPVVSRSEQMHLAARQCEYPHCKKVLEYLESNKMAVLNWSARKHDLNIIDNAWHLMVEVVCSDKQLNNRKQLIRALEKCAKKFNMETIMNFFKSTPGCLPNVIDVKGAEIQ